MKYALLLVLIVACNKGTDPAENYQDVPSVPRHDQPAPKQEYAVSPFSIQIPGTTSAVNPQFNEGIEGRISFQVTHDPRVTEYTLEVLEGPPGGRLTKSIQGKDLYEYRWTPPQRFISEGFSRVVNLVLVAKAEKFSEPRLATASQPTPFSLVVTRGNSAPRIMGVNDLSNDIGNLTKLEAGRNYPFRVIVEDKLATSARLLVEAKPCGQFYRRDRPQFDGNTYVSSSGVRETSDGRFEVQMQIDLESRPIPVSRVENSQRAESVEGVDLCFDLYAFNADTGLVSAAVRRVVAALYRPKNPVITLNDTDNVVYPGRTTFLQIAVDAGAEYGELLVTARTDGFPGNTNFECVPHKTEGKEVPNRLDCTFMLDVPPDTNFANRTYPLFVDAQHKVVRNNKPLTLSRTAKTNFIIRHDTNTRKK